jgi:hypothetical protein
MTTDLPEQRPEGKLLQEALKVDGRSPRAVAPQAGISDGRWRQIVKGWMHVGGVVQEVVAPPATLARMAYSVDVTPDALRAAGRDDAAEILDKMVRDAAQGTSVVPLPATGATGDQADEIDMIYASQTMSAEQKLRAIRQVLQLRAEVERDKVRARKKAPVRDTGAVAEQKTQQS